MFFQRKKERVQVAQEREEALVELEKLKKLEAERKLKADECLIVQKFAEQQKV